MFELELPRTSFTVALLDVCVFTLAEKRLLITYLRSNGSAESERKTCENKNLSTFCVLQNGEHNKAQSLSVGINCVFMRRDREGRRRKPGRDERKTIDST